MCRADGGLQRNCEIRKLAREAVEPGVSINVIPAAVDQLCRDFCANENGGETAVHRTAFAWLAQGTRVATSSLLRTLPGRV